LHRHKIETRRPEWVRVGPLKVGEILKLLEADGWYFVATRGSHRQFTHPSKPGRVTVAGKLSDDLHPKTRASILRQAGLS
jgi:predicted RNA binding protein YcfA (HicA-like mRNA interferase family)